MKNFQDKVNFLWSVADTLRGDYKQADYGKVILPLTVIRRLDAVLEPTKQKVLEANASLTIQNKDLVLKRVAGQTFYNVSPLDFPKLLEDPGHVAGSLRSYIAAFSEEVRETLEKFSFDEHIGRLDQGGILYQVVQKFAGIDLHPDRVSPVEMGYIFEELIRRFSEQSNETAGEHFTPREVIRLMVDLLFIDDDEALRDSAIIRSLFDPACGTGGMLSVAEEYLRELNPKSTLKVFGQELNPESWAICRADMMIKGQEASNIAFGNSFSQDGFADSKFDYFLSNPPFGVEWKKVEKAVRDDYEQRGFEGRFGAGLPRINDGSFLFLQHMISKWKAPEDGGSRLAIVFNGSPLFTGGAGSGESEIRRWLIENDWLEGIVALPAELFYNTDISTYVWVLTNRKRAQRVGKVQLVDSRDCFARLRKPLGEKRREITDGQIREIIELYERFEESDRVRIFPNHAFGYQRIAVEYPLKLNRADGTSVVAKSAKQAKSAMAEPRDPDGVPVIDGKGHPLPDPTLRDFENAPLPSLPFGYEQDPASRLKGREYRDAVDGYFEREVRPFAGEAWVDHNRTKIGYEIQFARHFYRYEPPRSLAEIDSELDSLEAAARELISEVRS